MDFLRERMLILRVVLAGTLLMSTVALYQFLLPIYISGILFLSRKWMAVLGLGGLSVILGLGILAFSWTSAWERLSGWFKQGLHTLERLGIFNLAGYALAIWAFSYLLLGRYGHYFKPIYLRLFLFWVLVLAGSLFLRAAGFKRSWNELLGASLVLSAFGFRILAYAPDVSTYPFSLGWSEASRYYYASLYFSRQIYGFSVPPTVLHPTRYLLQSVPFLISHSPLWVHRLWQVVLWVVITLLTSVALARRLSIPDRLRYWMMVGWTFLFLLLGPVYYHLQVPVIIVLIGFDRRKFWRSLGIVLLASTWAGISRINWFPVPGMLAAALFFLEEAVEKQSIWRYLLKPFVWSASGTLVAFAFQALYVVWSGNPTDQFTSSLSSDLLWYRLFPNPTYPTGILLDLSLVSLPVLLLLFNRAAGNWRAYHPIRILGLAAILFALLAGGIVVSVKIGGGSNLHNLDAFLTLLLVIAGYIFFGRTAREGQPGEEQPSEERGLQLNPAARWVLIPLTLAIPVFYTLPTGGPRTYPARDLVANDLAILTKFVDKSVQENGEILFISERELLTFQTVQGVRLVPDYEQVFLMEMAMAGNTEYLGRFHNDLKEHRFSLIISDPVYTPEKGSGESFGEENDAWVNQVSKYLLCYYQSQKKLRTVGVQLLAPRTEQSTCP